MVQADNRKQKGAQTWEEVMQTAAPVTLDTPVLEKARDFVMAEVWARDGLDRRSQRWISLACACAARTPSAIRIYMKAALDSKDITVAEMREFILLFAAYQGFPKAVEVELALNEILGEGASK
jgi:4-carboxymuconolactone decarboxylase